MTAFADAVEKLNQARADHLGACALATTAETTHGLDSPEAIHAFEGPQRAAVVAQIAAEEALAHTPVTTAQKALKNIASIARDFNDIGGPLSSLIAMIRILNQLATSESFDPDASPQNLSEAMYWMSWQGLDALKELDGMGSRIHRLASVDA